MLTAIVTAVLLYYAIPGTIAWYWVLVPTVVTFTIDALLAVIIARSTRRNGALYYLVKSQYGRDQ